MLVERRHSRRQFLPVSGTELIALTLEGTCAAEQAPYIGRPQKKLIGWGSDVAYPSKVQMNIRKIEQLPLDGIILSNFSGEKGVKHLPSTGNVLVGKNTTANISAR